MKKIDKITTLGKMMLKDKITSFWDKLLTEKPQGDLMVFYKKIAAKRSFLPRKWRIYTR